MQEVGNINPKGRIPFYHGKQLVYEWEQNLEEVLVYIKAPECILPKYREQVKKNLQPGQQMPKLDIKITPTHLSVGLIGLPPYLSEDFTSKVKASESLWSLEDDEIIITLEKALKAETWLGVFKGHEQINPFQKEEMQKKMLLERFQEEHGGFDFSDAEINGNVPDPKTFMGGIKYA
jgi:hypothetical protein